MNYSELTEVEKQQILKQRQKQFEIEHFQHNINKEAAVASKVLPPEVKQARIKASDDAMAVLEEEHAATVKELSKLKNIGL